VTSATARPYQSVYLRWWFSHVVLLAISVGILGLAVVMSPSSETLTLFGEPVPVLCSFRRLTGYGCPGCGMTRSMVFMAHGLVLDAFKMNPAGPPLFAFLATQVPWQAWKLFSGWSRRRAA